MSSDVNTGRRRFLIGTTVVVGGVGGIFAAVPFIKMWQPSAKARAAGAPVEIDISKLEPNQMITQAWRGRPVYVVRRTDEILQALPGENARLKDADSRVTEQQPEECRNEHRSLRPELLVVLGVCTHLGCSPKLYPDMAPQDFDAQWKGGFYCPCHNSRFDMAGRVYEGSPAATNLEVPPYRFIDDQRILIGEIA